MTITLTFGIFVFLVGIIPSAIMSGENGLVGRDVPDWFPLGLTTNFTATHLFNASFPADQSELEEFSLVGEDFRVWSQTIGSVPFVIIQHNNPLWFIPRWHALSDPFGTSPYWDHVEQFNQTDGTAIFPMKCSHTSVTVILSFNDDAYESLREAWFSDDVFVLVGSGIEQDLSTVNAFQLVGQIMFFQMPDVHPAIQMILGLTFWIPTAYVVTRIILWFIPLLGD